MMVVLLLYSSYPSTFSTQRLPSKESHDDDDDDGGGVVTVTGNVETRRTRRNPESSSGPEISSGRKNRRKYAFLYGRVV